MERKYIQKVQIFYIIGPMELNITNFDEEITSQCQKILEYTTAFEKQLSFYNPSEKEKTDRILIQLAYAIQKLRKIINPALSTGEIHGLPKDPERPDVLVVDLDRPNWDFKPWLQEKFSTVEGAYESVLENYEMDLSSLQLAPNSGLSPLQYVTERLSYQLKTIRAYSSAILEMFESGNLTVQDVKLEES